MTTVLGRGPEILQHAARKRLDNLVDLTGAKPEDRALATAFPFDQSEFVGYREKTLSVMQGFACVHNESAASARRHRQRWQPELLPHDLFQVRRQHIEP